MNTPAARPVCPMCHEPGIHSTTQACIDALRATVAQMKAQAAHLPKDPAVEYLGRWVPSFTP